LLPDLNTRFKYLGHIITNNCSDDEDIERGREREREREMFVRCNILARKLLKCSFAVKANFFFCPSVCVFMTLLFGVCRPTRLDLCTKYQSCYNKCAKLFFGYKRHDSVKGMLWLPSVLLTVLHNAGCLHCQMAVLY